VTMRLSRTTMKSAAPVIGRTPRRTRQEVLGTGEGRKDLRHPLAGRLSFEHAVFHHGDSSDQRLLLYSPLPDHDTPAKLARLLAA
jgi:hypothetical protein